MGEKKSNSLKAMDRRTRASERQKVRDSLTPAEQLAMLDKRLGKGVGAVKERNRLLAEMKSAKK